MKRGSGGAKGNDIAGLQLLPRDRGQARAFAVLNDPLDGFNEIAAAVADDAGVLLTQIGIAEYADIGRIGSADPGRTLGIQGARLPLEPAGGENEPGGA